MSQTSIEEASQILKNSGNSFHYRVIDFLRENNWYVLVSPFYNDSYTDKPREIDIIAEKDFDVYDMFGHKLIGTICVRLFIECKYITNTTVFWFDQKNLTKATERIIKDTPLDDPNLWLETSRHRYFNKDEHVAKLFETGGGKNFDNDPIYKALSQSLNALTYYRNNGSFSERSQHKYYNQLALVNYPIIVCNSFEKFYQYDVVHKSDINKVSENFLLEVQYAYIDYNKKNCNEYFLVDIVDFEKLNNLLENIASADVGAMKQKLSYDDRNNQ